MDSSSCAWYWYLRPDPWSVSTTFCYAFIRLHSTKDDQILMEIPELYKYGRERYWFSLKEFFIYMFDGAVQASILIFVILEMLTCQYSQDRHHFLHHILHLCVVNNGSQRWMEYIYRRIFNGMHASYSELSITYSML